MSLWISCVRPDGLPRPTSLGVRGLVDPGSRLYSAVIQPCPFPSSQAGTRSSTEAEQRTFVRPIVISADPAAKARTPLFIATSLN